jgi:hypothetical protein
METIELIVGWLLVITVGVGVVVLSIRAMRGAFSKEARQRRRRSRGHGHVISSKDGPSVRLAVDTEKPKNDRRS